MTRLNVPIKIMAMEMYFTAAITGSSAPISHGAIRPVPHMLMTSQPALPRHTLRFRHLKALSNLSMTRLSEVLRVDRRTPYNWEKGKPIDPVNEKHLELVIQVLTSFGEVSSELMGRSILAINEQGLSSADYLREYKYQEAGDQLARAIANQGISTVAAPLLGHRPLAQQLEVDKEADQGVPPTERVTKRVHIPLKAPTPRA